MTEFSVPQRATAFTHETVNLDGMTFEDCEFRKCRLIYSGGEAPIFEGCKFDGCDWRLDGPAADTLACLRAMWSAGAKPVVQGLIKDITGAR
jgi:hypothetical protein